MKNKRDKNNRWIVDVLLVVVIIAMGLFIYYRVNQMLVDRQAASDGSLTDAINEPVSEPTRSVVESEENQSASDQESQEITAQAAIDFRLETLNKGTVSLSDYAGTPVMVNFWATWCPPCRAEMPLIQEFAAENQGDLVVLAVNAGEEKSTVESFVTNQNFDDLVFLLDPANSVANLYRVSGFPTSLFINAEGMLQAAHIGELDRDLLVQYLAEIGVE